MFNLAKKAFILLVLGSAPFVYAFSTEEPATTAELPEYLEERKLSSSQYTQVDDLRDVPEASYVTIHDTDEVISENDRLVLYYNQSATTFKVLNKTTNYVFASHIEDPEAGTFNGLLSSAVGIDFIRLDRNYDLRQNVGLTDTIHTINESMIPGGIRLDISIGGFCATRACERFYPGYLDGTYTLEEMLDVGFTNIDIAFTVEVTLDETGVNVHIPVDSIVESSDTIRLASLTIFPGFGATKMDEVPGYMMIPDGAGALIRYEDNAGAFSSPYEAPFYGDDLGIPASRLSVSNYPLSLPVFGAVHGVYQHGFLGFVHSGDLSSRLVVYPNGSLNQPYNLMFAKYDYRRIYRQSFTTDGSAGAPRELRTLFQDIDVSYTLLDPADSHYVGMAHATREALNLSTTEHPDVPLHISYLMSDSEASFFGATLVPMTTTDAVRSMHQRFIDAGITTTDVILMGWNEGGHSGHLPTTYDIENSLGNRRDFANLYAYLNDTGDVALANSYVFAGEASDASYRRDMVSAVDRFKLTFNCGNCVYNETGVLSAASALPMMEDDLDTLNDHDIDYFDAYLGHTLSTMYQGEVIPRSDTAQIYQAMVESGRLNVANPSAYLLDALDKAYYMPSYHSSLEYFDDLIPFTATVLNRVMPLYSSYLNFNSIGDTGLLKLIDFGMFPAYILTDQPTSGLKNTDVSDFYTTEFSRWETSIIADYQMIQAAMLPVLNAELMTRDILVEGVVKKVFDNGITQYINYRSSAITIDGITLPPLSAVNDGGDA